MERDWQAVATAINDRMAELSLSQRELSDRSGVSVATLREIQHAKAARNRSDRLLADVSGALNWPEGYLKAVSVGELSSDDTGGRRAPGDDLTVVLTRLDQLHGEVRRLADAVDRLADDRQPGR